MSRKIEVDEEVFASLQARAEPLVDMPNDVLRRLLRLDAAKPTAGKSRRPAGAKRAPAGALLPEREYEIPLLQSILEFGGAAPMRVVVDLLETKIGSRLTPLDRDPLPTGVTRWRNRAQFVRLRLVERGDLERGSPHGIWAISAQGRARLAQEKKKRS